MNIMVIIILISLAWIISEIALAKIKHSKTEDSKGLDRSSLRLLWITIIACVFIGVFLGVQGIGLIKVKSHLISILGLVLVVSGLAIRWTAILTLKRYFTVNVSILSNHQIIDKGLYKYICHPAYAGSLLSFLGLGLAFSNWISTLVISVPICTAFIYRIKVEEEALVKAFGSEYLHYSKKTKRLIPGIW